MMDIGHHGATGHNVQLHVEQVLKQEAAHAIIHYQVHQSQMVVMAHRVQRLVRELSSQAAINRSVAIMKLISKRAIF